MFPEPVMDYNKHIGGSDGNAQQRACASSAPHQDVRYWWPMVLFMLEANVLNAHILYKINGGVATHREFQRQIALALLRNPCGQAKKRNILLQGGQKRKYAGPEHEWRRLPKKRYCTICTKHRTSRRPLQAISANQNTARRPPQTIWGCSHVECTDLAICKPK